MTTDPANETPEAWRVTLTCCGHDDGHWDAPTWEEADAFREAYTSGVGVAEFGYSSTLADGPGHRRSGIVTRLTPAPVQPPAPDPDETCDDGQANTCRHTSASGVDTTPLSDPDKEWRCDHCGLRWIGDRDGLWAHGEETAYYTAPVPPATTGGTDEAEGRFFNAFARALCETFEDDEGYGCEPEEPPCIRHVQEASDLLAARDARTRADALREAADELPKYSHWGTLKWLRDRADREATR